MENEPKFTTYIAIAKDLFAANPKFYSSKAQDAILSFAKYLDSGRELGGEMQMLALKKAREIDGEVLKACVDKFGIEPMREVIQGVYARHKHTTA